MSDDVIYLQQTLRDVVFRVDQVLGHTSEHLCPDCIEALRQVRIDAQCALDHDDTTDDHVVADLERG